VQEETPFETAQEIIVCAHEQGFRITDRQLKRWQSLDLIPRPTQQHELGTPGSMTRYPTGTSYQVRALCEIQAHGGRNAVVWGKKLWWLGFPVGPQYGLDVLKQRAIGYGKFMPRFIAAVLGPANASLSNKLKTVRTTDKIFGALRRRLGKNFPYFLSFIALLLEGDFNRWSDRMMDEDIAREIFTIDRAFGFWRAKNLADIMGRAELHGDVDKVFEALSSRLGRVDLVEVLNACSDADIQTARNQLCAILFAASGLVQGKNEKQGFGLKTLSIFHRYASLAVREIMLLYFLALSEEDDFKNNANSLMGVFRSSVPSNITAEQLTSFRLREPAIAQAVWK
jgi:hypothetical protein